MFCCRVHECVVTVLMADGMMTSERPDVNISSNINVTAAETGTIRLSLATPPIIIIVRVTVFLSLAAFNLCGNGFTLITIRMTPRLWTKTNFILASMLLANVITGVFMFWYTPYLLVVYVFNNPCRYNVLTTAVMPLMKISGYVSTYHVIPVSVERYIAIVYPLHYENKFTDRTMKWAIFAVWATGIFMGMTHWMWFVNANLKQCILVPVDYFLVEVLLIYIPVCICLFACYGKILAISWRQRRCIEPQPANTNRVAGPPIQTIVVATRTQSNKATAGHNTDGSNGNSLTCIGTPSQSAYAASSELMQEQRRQKIKSRRREFKAVYLTAAIVGTFVVLRFPYMLGRVLASAGCNPVVVNYISLAAGAIGAFNFSFTWAIYAAVSKS